MKCVCFYLQFFFYRHAESTLENRLRKDEWSNRILDLDIGQIYCVIHSSIYYACQYHNNVLSWSYKRIARQWLSFGVSILVSWILTLNLINFVVSWRDVITDQFSEFIWFYWRLPYDWKRFPTPYMIAMGIELIYGCISFQVAAFYVCFLLGSAILTITLVNDLKDQILKTNERWKASGNKVELLESIRDSIKFNADLKQLSHIFNPIKIYTWE